MRPLRCVRPGRGPGSRPHRRTGELSHGMSPDAHLPGRTRRGRWTVPDIPWESTRRTGRPAPGVRETPGIDVAQGAAVPRCDRGGARRRITTLGPRAGLWGATMALLGSTTFKLLSATSAMATAGLLSLTATAATAGSADADHDGMPNRWEASHGLNPHRANAGGDKDHDGLRNIAEYHQGTDPADEDTDNDGDDDGDEVHDGTASTDPEDADTDDAGVKDGDEDADHDGVDNEDEADATESCVADDDDSDSDDDGTPDGDETDDQGTQYEDEDDQGQDDCASADQGEDDDDQGDDDQGDGGDNAAAWYVVR